MNKKWARTHPKEYRESARRSHHKILGESRKTASHAHARWFPWEEKVLINSSLTHKELGKLLGRSIQSVQAKRVRLQGQVTCRCACHKWPLEPGKQCPCRCNK